MDVNLNQNVSYSFIIEDRSGSNNNRRANNGGTSGGRGSSGGGAGGNKGAKRVNAIIHSAPVAIALSVADTLVTAEINRVELRTGLSTLQQQLQWKKNTAVSIGKSIVSIGLGLATGNVLAAGYGIFSLVNTGLGYAVAVQDLKIKKQVEDVSIGMANIRAGSGGPRNPNGIY